MYTLIYVSFLFACSRIYAAVDTDRLVDTAKSEQLLLSTCNMCLPDDTRRHQSKTYKPIKTYINLYLKK